MQNSQAKKCLWISVPLVMCWLAGTVYAFWWFQVRDLRPFDASAQDQVAVFQGAQLAGKLKQLQSSQESDETRQTLMVHFWNPECPCNKFNNEHVRKIIAQYHDSGIRFITVVHSLPGQDSQELISQAEELFNVPALVDTRLQLDPASAPAASPAAAVMTAKGELAYFGPYSNGAFCGAGSGTFVEKALETVLEGQQFEESSTLAFGCFCQWKPSASA